MSGTLSRRTSGGKKGSAGKLSTTRGLAGIWIFIALLCPFLSVSLSHSQEIGKEEIKTRLAALSVPFLANKGQADKDVAFYSHIFGGTAFVTRSGGMGYAFTTREGHAVIREEVEAAAPLTPRGEEPATTKIASFRGSDPSGWKSDIPAYESISLGEVSRGITLSLKARGRNVEKIFTVLPGTEPRIRMNLSGAKELSLTDSGELEVVTDVGSLAFTRPVAFQEIEGQRVPVMVAYALPSARNESSPAGTYEFAVGPHNPRYPLVIDPLLASTYIGGSAGDSIASVAVDAHGNVYVAGYTDSSDYPTTAGAYSRKFLGWFDVIVSKLDGSLSRLLASTYIGGRDRQVATTMALDPNGNVYVAGYTGSSDFPTTAGAYNRTMRGTMDVFVTKLDSSLTTILASTLIGMGNAQEPEAMALDGQGNVYLTGYTDSPYYPTTAGAYDRTFRGSYEAFVSKLDSGLTRLLASTLIGGSAGTWTTGLALDSQGNVFIVGNTSSPDYPTTAQAYDRTWNGGAQDVFVSKLDSGLTTLLASTFLGGSSDDKTYTVALDRQGNVYVAGETFSSDFPTTAGAYDRHYRGLGDVFAAKLNGSLSSLLASTFLGGSQEDMADTLSLDSQGNVYVTGYTSSRDYPFTRGAFCKTVVGDLAGSVSKLNPGLSALQTSSCLSGAGEWGLRFALDGKGNIYLAGTTSRTDFPTTPGAYDRHYHGIDDGFISKLDAGLSGSLYSLKVGKRGTGTGTVQSQVAGIDCGSVCTGAVYSSDSVKLTAVPDKGSVFWGWSGVCTGTSMECTFRPTGNSTVYAAFLPDIIDWSTFFPLKQNTTWDYLVNGRIKERVRLISRVSMLSSLDHSQEYYTTGINGIRLHGGLLTNQYASGYGPFDVTITMLPPMILAPGNASRGIPYAANGTTRYSFSLFNRSVDVPYHTVFTVDGFEAVTVPAGTFQAMKISYTMTIYTGTETGSLHLAEGIGMVRKTSTISGKTTLRELAATNANVRDLAVTAIAAPALINFTSKIVTKTAPVTVTIQNRGPYPETITSRSVLASLITLTPQSLGKCVSPVPVLAAPARFPVTIQPKGALTATYNVTFTCANDPAKSTAKDPHHYDYRYTAKVDRAVLDGASDTHPSDDTCPRTVTPPYVTDPYPDGTIKDRGCGALKPDRTYGNDVLTDIVVSAK